MREDQQYYPANQEKRLPREFRKVIAEDRLEHRCVCGKTARELPRPSLGEEARREVNQVLEQILPELRNHELGRRCEQVHLDEVQQRLYREEHEQSDRDLVQQRRIRGDKSRVEEVPHDLRKCERDARAAKETNERDHQPRHVRTYARQQSSKRTRRDHGWSCSGGRSLRRDRELW